MAKEYIEREAAKRELLFWAVCMNHPEYLIKDDALHVIDSMPAADVAPVRHGRWIEKDKYSFGTFYDCSICGNCILDNGHSWNYCPNCGADMRGSNDEKVWEDKHEAL